MTSKVTRLMPETGIDDPGSGHAPGQEDALPQRPDPEVPERARRRTFTAKYKLEILAAYDAAADGDGEKGALLRREGLYSSHIVEWRRARDAGALAALAAPRGRKPRDKRRTSRSLLCKLRSSDWSRSWPRPASWWTCRQNCTRSWRRSPRAATPSRGRHRDRHRDRRAGTRGGRARGLRGPRRGTGRLLPAAPPSPPPQRPAPIPHRDRDQPRALTEAERQAILDQLHSDRFVDVSPTEVWATLLDEGVYLGSISTFYRLLGQAGESPGTPPAGHPPCHGEAGAGRDRAEPGAGPGTSPSCAGRPKWTYYYLYVIIDIYSRYVVGWMDRRPGVRRRWPSGCSPRPSPSSTSRATS